MTSCYKAAPVSRDKIRHYVRAIKRKAGLEDKLYFPILHFVENVLPSFVPGFQFEVVDGRDLGDKHGETFPSCNIMRIREDIYLRAADGEGRDRLTIAHEVGHLFMHVNPCIRSCLDSNERLRVFEDPEWQASAFGGELLASSYLIANMTEREVQEKCGVSLSAAHVQVCALQR